MIEQDSKCNLLNEPPFFQCCCKCKYHIEDFYHCSTVEIRKGCVCSQHKGWICFPPGFNRAHSDWPEHSAGCEMFHDTRENVDD